MSQCRLQRGRRPYSCGVWGGLKIRDSRFETWALESSLAEAQHPSWKAPRKVNTWEYFQSREGSLSWSRLQTPGSRVVIQIVLHTFSGTSLRNDLLKTLASGGIPPWTDRRRFRFCARRARCLLASSAESFASGLCSEDLLELGKNEVSCWVLRGG